MKPPIPVPWPETSGQFAITRRIEWDDAEQCFFLCYRSRFWDRLRCELKSCRYNRYYLCGVVFGFPIFLSLLSILSLSSRHKVSRVCIFPWGIRDIADIPGEIRWEEFHQVLHLNGDILVTRHPFYKGSFYLTKQSLETEEGLRLVALLNTLRRNRGTDWDGIKNQFATSKRD